MLTVKWITRETARGEVTRIYEAHEVLAAYRSPSERPGGEPRQQWQVAGREVDGHALFVMNPDEPGYAGRSFDTGTIYVMNETGATVGKYVLSDDGG